MSNTVITNYTDLNGPSTKADSSVVVIVNKDGSLSVDQKLLGTLMGTDGSQSAGISVVRVGHEGKPDDATDSETDDEKVPHVTLSVDSYYDEPNSIIKYDSGAEMLQSLRIETRENSLVGFQNDHCYTPLKSPSQIPEKSDSVNTYDESIIEISHTPPPKPVPSAKKITILEQQIIPKGKKILIKPSESPILLKANDILNKPVIKSKEIRVPEKSLETLKSDESSESSSISSSGDSIPDRDSDSDYKDTKDRSGSLRVKRNKLKPRILKAALTKATKPEPKAITKLKSGRNILRKEAKEKLQQKHVQEKKDNIEVDLESLLPSSKISTTGVTPIEPSKVVVKQQTPKAIKKDKRTPSHVTALLSDMTSLFSTPDVIRRVSTDTKVPPKTPTNEKEISFTEKKTTAKVIESNEGKVTDNKLDEKLKTLHKTYVKPKEKVIPAEKTAKQFDVIPQLDDASLAQILQDTTGISNNPVKSQSTISPAGTLNSPSLVGPLSPTLDLLGGLQPEEEGLTEDFLMSVAQLVASSENLQEVIDKQVLGKVDSVPAKTPQTPQTVQASPTTQQTTSSASLYSQTLTKSAQKTLPPRKDPIEIVRRDGRVITLPPIEAPATRSSKRKSQMEITNSVPVETPQPAPPPAPVITTPDAQVLTVSKQYINKKLTNKKQEPTIIDSPPVEKMSAESQESWNSEDDPNRLWCICKQPHNNRFMICCDGCEDWFHGKCVNITKAMGQQMEEQGMEWRCPNCIKKAKPPSKITKGAIPQSKTSSENASTEIKSPPAIPTKDASKTNCIVCKKPARASSIYCSNTCIWKHAQDSLGNQNTSSKGDGEPGKSNEKQKAESRVIVYERKSGRLLAGPNAPTAENLKAWLQSNPTFEVVRPGTLSTIKPGIGKKKSIETNKIQTTLNFARIPKKSADNSTPAKSPLIEVKERREIKLIPTPRMEPKQTPQLKSPVTPKSQPPTSADTPKASTSRPMTEPRKIIRATGNRSQSLHDKAPSVSPSTSRRKDSSENRPKMTSGEPIRYNVRKALEEQMSLRMAEYTGPKFTEKEIQNFANDTELELHELFRDVGMKYKAKYRSLVFNIKDRKNLTLWQKICDRSITPKQLVRLSPEELASQELAQWRDKEAKHQLELIKKSELDLLAASKTYVLKTHKGEEVMETKESVSTELDPNVPIEDVVTALNDSTVGSDVLEENSPESNKTEITAKKHNSKKRSREDISSGNSKKSRRDSKRDSDRKSKSSRKRSDSKEKDSKDQQRRSMRRSEKKLSRTRSPSKDRSKPEKDKSDTGERSRRRSSLRRSKSREYSRSKSQGRERSRSRARSKRRSQSRDSSKRRPRSRSTRRVSSDDKLKHRSRSQDNVYSKSKHDSTDSDSIDRPKSATLKDSHPEYDPHEPMITSAFSEEDLRKSREDVFEENYRNDMSEFESDYDPSKLIESNLIVPETTYTTTTTKQDKTSGEVESDQEPSSTVDNSSATVWSGCINMVDVARFYVAAHEVSGSSADLEEDLSTELDIVGRINPDTVWDYITKMKKTSNKDIVILRLQTANDEEKMQYIALYSYLSSRNRLGVVKVTNMTTVKDFYIVPLPANTTLPAVLLPLDGPGMGEIKTHLLIGIVIRQKKKRVASNIPSEVIPAKMSRKRSYTPPASPKRRVLPLPAYTSTTLSTTVKDKIAASLVSADDDEPYSPGSSSSSNSASASATGPTLTSNTLRTKMEELNRQIEEQKQQILKMAQADSSVGEDEAYSPSRPMTPPAPVQNVPLADISLPSNLQEILATIKQRSETSSADVDMRTLPLP